MEDQANSQLTEDQQKEKILHEFTPVAQKKTWREIFLPAGIILLIILAGAVSGYFLSNKKGGSAGGAKMIGGKNTVSSPEEMGIKDSESFPDKAQGKVEVNDSKEITEGSHKLVRPGGESQTAYITSSVVDLNQFIGKCVEVWGETFSGQKAGWLMDIGFVKKLDKCPEGL